MKNLLLFIIIYGLMGFILDYVVRQLSNVKGIVNKIKSCKQLINIFVYASGGGILYLILLIPIFKQLAFLPLLILMGAITLTLVEFGWGYLLNIILKWNIWDYSNSKITIGKITIPLNIMGQIDLVHFILWGLLSIPIFFIQNILLFLVR